jgi:hypothetical protein
MRFPVGGEFRSFFGCGGNEYRVCRRASGVGKIILEDRRDGRSAALKYQVTVFRHGGILPREGRNESN